MNQSENQPANAATGLRANRKTIGIAAGVLVSALCILASAAYTREPPPPAAQTPGMRVENDSITLAPDAPQWRVIKLGTAKAATTHFSDPVPARVKMDETKAAKVGAPLAGRVSGVMVELGQQVKQNDPLFSVASPDIASLRAEREKAAVDADVAKTAFDRVKAMVELHAVPGKEELEANQQYKQAQVALKLAQSKLASLKVSSKADNEFTVVSPRDGIVVEKNVLPSQEISQEAGLVTVADLSTVWVVADLFEADAVGIKAGTLAKITSPSLPGFEAQAPVEVVSAVVDPSRHTVPVRVKLPNADGQLKPNVYAQMRFSTDPPPGAVEIAASALVSDGAHQYVYVQGAQGEFSRREVVAGSAHEGVVPILKGLKDGEVVAEQGASLLDNQIAIAH